MTETSSDTTLRHSGDSAARRAREGIDKCSEDIEIVQK